MIIVSDTSPINYLVLTGYIDTLPALFGEIIVPKAVYQELLHAKAPAVVKEWVNSKPSWFTVHEVVNLFSAEELGVGEQEAISLAVYLKANLFLCDDMAARQFARRQNLLVLGTLGILEEAAKQNRLNLQEAVQKLTATSCRLRADVVREALMRDEKRREG